jgi:hypothetical protein
MIDAWKPPRKEKEKVYTLLASADEQSNLLRVFLLSDELFPIFRHVEKVSTLRVPAQDTKPDRKADFGKV